jgi:hypothetical protein
MKSIKDQVEVRINYQIGYRVRSQVLTRVLNQTWALVRNKINMRLDVYVQNQLKNYLNKHL